MSKKRAHGEMDLIDRGHREGERGIRKGVRRSQFGGREKEKMIDADTRKTTGRI